MSDCVSLFEQVPIGIWCVRSQTNFKVFRFAISLDFHPSFKSIISHGTNQKCSDNTETIIGKAGEELSGEPVAIPQLCTALRKIFPSSRYGLAFRFVAIREVSQFRTKVFRNPQMARGNPLIVYV